MPSATVFRRQLPAMLPAVAGASIAAAAAAGLLAVLALRSTSPIIHLAAPALLVPVAAWMFFSEHYERTLAVLALYLGLLDGFLKLKTGSTIATLGRDVLLYAIAGGAVVRVILSRRPVRVPKLAVGVVVWLVICAVQVLNPIVPSITHAAAGLRQHIEFVPLFFLGYAVMRSERRLMGLLALLLVVAAANGVVALVQSRLTLAQLASWGPGYAREVYGSASVTSRLFAGTNGVLQIRPSALGSDFGFGGMVGVLAAPAVLALGSAWSRSRRGFVIAIVGAPLVVLAIITSQSRLAVVAAAVATVTYLLLTATTRKGAQTLAAAAVLGVLAYAAVPVVFPTAAQQANRYASIAPTQVIATTVSDRSLALSLLPHYALTYPLGAGIGENGPAASSAVGGSQIGTNNAESEFNFLLLEVGLPGLIVLTALTAIVIRMGIRLRRTFDTRLQRSLMALVAANVGIGAAWIAAATTATSPTAPFFWFTAGTIVYWSERAGGRHAGRARRE